MEEVTIVTHDGIFHADDVMATAIAGMVHPYASIVRTRNQAKINEANIVIDVGGVYNADQGRFDHHQRDFKLVRPSGTPYASAGLAWMHFGLALITTTAMNYNVNPFIEKYPETILTIDAELMEPIDANDTGYARAGSASFSDMVRSMNAPWLLTQGKQDDELNFKRFMKAVDGACDYLEGLVLKILGQYEAETIVHKAITEAEGNAIVFEQPLPWINAVLNSKLEKAKDIKLAIYPANNGSWGVQSLPVSSKDTSLRASFPEQFRGISGEAMTELTGVKGLVFCHAGGHLAFSQSKDTAMALAKLVLKG